MRNFEPVLPGLLAHINARGRRTIVIEQ